MLYKLFDRDSDGSVDLKEVLLGFGLLSGGTPEARLKAAFDAFDTDPKDGQLDTAELRTLLITMCGVPVDAAGRRATTLMAAGDKDGDGQLDEAEFVAAMISGAGGALPNFIALGCDSEQLKFSAGSIQAHDLGECFKTTVTFHAPPANNLTCPPSYILI